MEAPHIWRRCSQATAFRLDSTSSLNRDKGIDSPSVSITHARLRRRRRVAHPRVYGGSRGGAFGLAGWRLPACQPRAVRHLPFFAKVTSTQEASPMARTSRATSRRNVNRIRSSAASPSSKSTATRAARKSTRPRRIGIHNPASKVRQARCVARTSREHSHASGADGAPARKVPSITVSGAWLRSAGFKIGKPCLVRAFAYRQLVICQPG